MSPTGFLSSQPRGVALLALTGLWERFSYYGTQSLLVLFLISATTNGGFGWSQSSALRLFGIYAGFIWLAPLLGGWIADRFLGARKCVALGCVAMALGHFCLAGPAVVPQLIEHASGIGVGPLQESSGVSLGRLLALQEVKSEIELSLSAVGMESHEIANVVRPMLTSYVLTSATFYLALSLLIIGSGLFTGNITVILGQLYATDDQRRDSGFTLYYIGINVGAFLAPFAAGTLGEWMGWHYGFTLAGFGMLVGLVVFLRLQGSLLGQAGTSNTRDSRSEQSAARLSADERARVRFILLICLSATVFWAAYMQFGGLINVYGFQHTDREMGDFTVPATWFLSINPIAIVVLGPLAVVVWSALARAGRPVPTPTKIAAGLIFLGIAYLVMVGAAWQTTLAADARSHWVWLVAFHLMLTLGELCVSPVGLAMVSRLAPQRFAGMLMGVWLLSMALGNFIAGFVGAWSSQAGLVVTFGVIAASLFFAAFLLRLMAREPSEYSARRFSGADSPRTPSS